MSNITQSSNAVTLRDDIAALASSLDGIMINGIECRNMENNFLRVFSVGQCMANLRQALSDEVIVQYIMPMQGSPLGFRTDQDRNGGYDVAVVRDAIIAATMSGLMPCGNQFNIISGRMYVTKEGFTHLLKQMDGLRYTLTPSVPQASRGGATVVSMKIEWDLNGEKGNQTLDIPVRVNNGMGDDAVLGKADRKAKAWLYNNLTSSELNDGEMDEPISSMRNATPEKAAPAPRKRASAPAGGLQAVAAPSPTPAPALEPIDDAPPYFPEEEEIGEPVSYPSVSAAPSTSLFNAAELNNQPLDYNHEH